MQFGEKSFYSIPTTAITSVPQRQTLNNGRQINYSEVVNSTYIPTCTKIESGDSVFV